MFVLWSSTQHLCACVYPVHKQRHMTESESNGNTTVTTFVGLHHRHRFADLSRTVRKAIAAQFPSAAFTLSDYAYLETRETVNTTDIYLTSRLLETISSICAVADRWFLNFLADKHGYQVLPHRVDASCLLHYQRYV